MSLTDTAVFVTRDQLAEIARDIWLTFVGLDTWPVDDPGGPVDVETVTGCTQVSGAWEGTVLVEVGREHSRLAAGAMFAAPTAALHEDDVSDALGELTNIVAGNVKGALPFPAQLSFPSVARGGSYSIHVPGARLVEQVLVQSSAGPMRVSVWQISS